MNPEPPSSTRSWIVREEVVCWEAPPWLAVTKQTVELPDGTVVPDYYQVKDRSYVEILARRTNGDLLGLWRYKHGPRGFGWGFPAGYIEPGEDPLVAAKRELQEEAGLTSESWRSLGSFFVDGNRTQSQMHLFAVDGVIETGFLPSDDLEESTLDWAALSAWRERLLAGEVPTAGASLALARFLIDTL